MSIPEKLRALATRAENANDLEGLKWRVLMVVQDIDLMIERERPGYAIDRMLGGTEDNNGIH